VVDTKECFYVHDGKSSLKKYVVWYTVNSLWRMVVKRGLTKTVAVIHTSFKQFIKLEMEFTFIYYHLDIELKYVHQLQNLYLV
jgi:hypothetical protein